MNDWETVIGLEIHAQLLTKTKLFCGCPITFGETPNSKVCPICLGMPGTLPVLNENASTLALKAAAALHCTINEKSVFARKNYFYPDLPKGYQISQYDKPLAQNGSVEILIAGKPKTIGITRVHMEEDAGKLIHDGASDFSQVDFNRSCVPLIEIVSEPEISSPEEASEYLKMLRLILIYNGVCDGNMELGNLRCDANISVRKFGEKKLGVKTELKNMNSFNFIGRALEYEIKRHIDILSSGGRIVQETLFWDQKANKTISMRSKEEAHDYRYFEEPDLLPLKLDPDIIVKTKNDPNLIYSETINKRLKDLIEIKKIPHSKASTIVNSPNLSQIFENSLKLYSKNPQRTATFITDILPMAKESKAPNEEIPLFISSIVESEDGQTISLNMGKDLLIEAVTTGKDPKTIINSKGLKQISSSNEIDGIIAKVLLDFGSQVQEYKSGREQLFNFLLGQLMKETKGKVNPKAATERLKEKLKG